LLSEELGKYLMLKLFWKNLGMSFKEVENLTYYDFEMLYDIMKIESQEKERQIKKAASKNKHG